MLITAFLILISTRRSLGAPWVRKPSRAPSEVWIVNVKRQPTRPEYLNRRGTPLLQNTFTKILSSIFSWQKDENGVTSTPLLIEKLWCFARLKPAPLLRVKLLHGCFSYFLNCTNGTKSRITPQPQAKNVLDKININVELRSLRVKNLNKLIIGHLNINSLRNKFELLTHQIKDNIDILMISETKLGGNFPTSQFFMKGFSSLHRFDPNCNGGGIILYIRKDMLSKLLSVGGDLTEAFFLKLVYTTKKNY